MAPCARLTTRAPRYIPTYVYATLGIIPRARGSSRLEFRMSELWRATGAVWKEVRARGYMLPDRRAGLINEGKRFNTARGAKLFGALGVI